MRSRLEEIAARLVAFDTVSAASNVAAVEYLAGELEDAGARVCLQRWEAGGVPKANLVGVVGPVADDGLIVSGHVDTVPFAGQPGWTRDPLRLECSDERLYGRGISDMKGFLAQCVVALRGLDHRRLARPIVFAFTADEEIGCLGAERLVTNLPDLLGEVPVPRQAWIGEPTSFAVFHAHKGIGVFDVRVRGRGGHSSRPDLGVNAIVVMGRVLETLRRLQDETADRIDPEHVATFPEAPGTTFNVGTIRGGTATNMIAEECAINVSFRFPPGVDPQEIHTEAVRRLLAVDARDRADGENRATVEPGGLTVVPGLQSPRGTPLEQALREATGGGESRGALFVTDGCRFAQAGIASIVCGPGDLEQAHQPDESIPREAFDRGPDLIRDVVERWLRSPAW